MKKNCSASSRVVALPLLMIQKMLKSSSLHSRRRNGEQRMKKFVEELTLKEAHHSADVEMVKWMLMVHLEKKKKTSSFLS